MPQLESVSQLVLGTDDLILPRKRGRKANSTNFDLWEIKTFFSVSRKKRLNHNTYNVEVKKLQLKKP